MAWFTRRRIVIVLACVLIGWAALIGTSYLLLNLGETSSVEVVPSK
jgi:hypothetical protein